MDREILFRGKRLEVGAFATETACEWVYGGYTKDCSGEYIHSIMHNPRMVRVDPSTVGQYTGLTDKNGVAIFEGDILHRRWMGELRIYKVCYDNDFAAFIGKCANDERFTTFDSDGNMFEIVGNIHDNPELLEV